jgi:hypothetical protein
MQSGGGLALPERPFLSTLPGILLIAFGVLLLVAAIAAAIVAVAWRRGTHGLAPYQQPYDQLMRLGRWFGTLRTTAHTPFEVAEGLSRQVPGASDAIHDLTVYVEGTYSSRAPASNPWPTWLEARRDVVRGLFRRRLRRWFGDDGTSAPPPRSHPELLRQWGASRSTTPTPPPGAKPRLDR